VGTPAAWRCIARIAVRRHRGEEQAAEMKGGEERPVGGGGVKTAVAGGEGGARVGACDGEAPHYSDGSKRA
jgi:hypothetical protein